jgi:hypothetical protein
VFSEKFVWPRARGARFVARGEGEQRDVARLLDRERELALMARADARQAAGNDLAALGDEALQQPHVAVADGVDLLRAELADLLAAEELASSRTAAGSARSSRSALWTGTSRAAAWTGMPAARGEGAGSWCGGRGVRCRRCCLWCAGFVSHFCFLSECCAVRSKLHRSSRISFDVVRCSLYGERKTYNGKRTRPRREQAPLPAPTRLQARPLSRPRPAVAEWAARCASPWCRG